MTQVIRVGRNNAPLSTNRQGRVETFDAPTVQSPSDLLYVLILEVRGRNLLERRLRRREARAGRPGKKERRSRPELRVASKPFAIIGS